MLDPRRLRLLVQLEGLGTVRAVAAAASMSPSAVSQQLAVLEQESGAALFERQGRSIALTPAGRALVVDARGILERIGAAEEHLRALHGELSGVVRVGAFTSALGAFAIDAAAAVALAHPGLAVYLDELEPHRSVPALVRGDVDVALTADFGVGSFAAVPHTERVSLGMDELLAVLPVGHAAAVGSGGGAGGGGGGAGGGGGGAGGGAAAAGGGGGAGGGAVARAAGRRRRLPPIPLSALREDGWLLDGTDLERHVVPFCRAAGFEPRVVGRLAHHSSLLRAVATGLGVTVLPAFAIDASHAVVTRRLTPGTRRELLALMRTGAAGRRSIGVVVEALVAAAARAG